MRLVHQLLYISLITLYIYYQTVVIGQLAVIGLQTELDSTRSYYHYESNSPSQYLRKVLQKSMEKWILILLCEMLKICGKHFGLQRRFFWYFIAPYHNDIHRHCLQISLTTILVPSKQADIKPAYVTYHISTNLF